MKSSLKSSQKIFKLKPILSLSHWFNHTIEQLENNRFGLLVFTLVVQGTLIAPATFFAIISTNNSMILLVLFGIMSFGVVVSNIAIAPVRVIVNIFVVSTVGHLIIIFFCIFR